MRTDLMLILVALFSSMGLATLLPPLQGTDRAAAVHTTLLCAGGVATLVAVTLAMTQQLTAGALALVGAWLLIVPCLWLARATQPDEADGYTEEDDDGGLPPAPWSPRPGSSDRGRAELGAIALTNAVSHGQGQFRPVLAPQARVQPLAAPHAQFQPLAAPQAPPQQVLSHVGQFQTVRMGASAPVAANAQAPVYTYVPGPYGPVTTPPMPVVQPDVVVEQDLPAELGTGRLTTPVRPERGDHRGIVHMMAPVAHGRVRERASIPARLIDRCQQWRTRRANIARDGATSKTPTGSL